MFFIERDIKILSDNALVLVIYDQRSLKFLLARYGVGSKMKNHTENIVFGFVVHEWKKLS